MESIPNEILHLILTHLSYKQRCSITCINFLWNYLINTFTYIPRTYILKDKLKVNMFTMLPKILSNALKIYVFFNEHVQIHDLCGNFLYQKWIGDKVSSSMHTSN